MTPETAREVRGYARISRDAEHTKIGTDRQKRVVNEFATAFGMTIDRWHTDDDTSAWNGSRRDDWDELIADIWAGRVAVVFAWAQDRLIRDHDDSNVLLKACRATGTRMIFKNEGELHVSTASGKLMYRVKSAVAENESDVKSERVKEASLERAQNGKAHGPVLYGWTRVYDYDTSSGVRVKGAWHDVLHDEQAEVVRELCRRVLGGESMKALARDLNSRGIPSPRAAWIKEKKGLDVYWEAATVRVLLLRPANAGLRVFQGTPQFTADAPAILNRGDWDRLVALINDPARRTITDNRVQHLLSGIAKCGVCGRGMRHKAQDGKSKYMCPQGCVGRRLEPIDTLVTSAVIKFLADPAKVQRLLTGDDVAALEAMQRAADLRAELVRLDDDRADGLLDRDRWKRQVERITPRLESAERAARSTASRADDVLADVLGMTTERWLELPITRRRSIVEALYDIRVMPLATTNRRAPFDPDLIAVTEKWADAV